MSWSLLAQFLYLLLLVLYDTKYCLVLVFQVVQPGFLLLVPPLFFSRSASIRLTVLGKPKTPRHIWSKASCSSRFFRILEGLCQLVLLSVGNKLSRLNLADCLKKSFLGYRIFLFSSYFNSPVSMSYSTPCPSKKFLALWGMESPAGMIPFCAWRPQFDLT